MKGKGRADIQLLVWIPSESTLTLVSIYIPTGGLLPKLQIHIIGTR